MNTTRAFHQPPECGLRISLSLFALLVLAAGATAETKLRQAERQRKAARKATERREDAARQKQYAAPDVRLDQRIPTLEVRIGDVKIDDQGYLDEEIRRERREQRAEAQTARPAAEIAAAQRRRRREKAQLRREARERHTRATHRQSTRIILFGF